MTSYLTFIDTFSLSRTVFEIFDFEVFRVWPWPLTFKSQLSVENIFTLRKPIHDFLSNFLLTLSLSRTVFEIFDFEVLQGSTLTFDLYKSPWVKSISIIRKPIHDFLSNFHWHFLSISYRFRDIRLYKFLGFDLDLWPSEVTWGQNIFTLRRPIHDFLSNFYWHFFSLSRTVFYFEILRNVWPWPLTFIGHLESKVFSPFESPYMTSYLTSIDIFSLSRTVFEIFDFEVFRVWPWPLTFKDHLGSNIFHHSKAHTWLPI